MTEILPSKDGYSRDFGHFVVSAAFTADNTLAFALGNGSLELVPESPEKQHISVAAHAGATLCMAASPVSPYVYSGGDDGCIRRVGVDGSLADYSSEKGSWVGSLIVTEAGLAYTSGRDVTWRLHGAADSLRVSHPSTAVALALNSKGKRIAVAHYNGISLWWTAGGQSKTKHLSWRGSHTAVTWSPDGSYIVSATQENELHGWRLVDGSDFRMAGYPRKVRSFAWVQRGQWLATGGAETIVLWPFHGRNGPTNREPNEIAVDGGVVTTVAAHPAGDRIAAGMEDGTVWLAQISSNARMLVRPGKGAAVTALAWSRGGSMLAAGTEQGEAMRWHVA
jgi:WD40 repeat protein